MRRPWTTAISPWLHLGSCDRNVLGQHAKWRRIDTGAPTGLSSDDYLAEEEQTVTGIVPTVPSAQ